MKLNIINLGITDYSRAFALQKDLLHKRIKESIPDTLVVLEHKPVITLGRTDDETSIINRRYFDMAGTDVLETRRGGKITYHAPGQLIMYPIIYIGDNMRDIGAYIDFLEETVVRSLRCLNVPAERDGSRRGVWLGGKKIAFIGISVKNWVTYHGVAVNINNDIEAFNHIDPCGESDIKVTSAREYTGKEMDIEAVKKVFCNQFEKDMADIFTLEAVGAR